MHPALRPLSVGGVLKIYGGAGPYHFDGGLLVGDAGCFVDPLTGEGITPAMESGGSLMGLRRPRSGRSAA